MSQRGPQEGEREYNDRSQTRKGSEPNCDDEVNDNDAGGPDHKVENNAQSDETVTPQTTKL